MGNCLKPVHEEETKPLVISAVHEQVVLSNGDCSKQRKKVRFKVQADNAAASTMDQTTTMRPPRILKKGVRVKVVLTQSELKHILDRATAYNHQPPPSSSIDRIVLSRRRSRRSPLMCRCSWNPALQTIPECSQH